MPFKIAEALTSGLIDSGTIQTLNPGPTYTDYPERFNVEAKTSKDGGVVLQYPPNDARVRHWIWENYKFDIPKYDALYNTLLNLHSKLRLTASPPKNEYVFLYEDVTEEFSPLAYAGGVWDESNDFVRVKVVAVTREVRKSGGKATYDITRLSFVISDPNWNGS